MSEDILKYQCPSCGAPLEFDPAKQLLVCDSCDSEYPEEFFKEHQKQEDDSGIDMDAPPPSRINWKVEGFVKERPQVENQAGFSCTSCGAEVVAGDTVATECMYCGNPIVLSDNISGMVEPDLVLPFKITKEQAEQMLTDFYKGKLLLPNEFKSANKISKITGMYVPFWLFSCEGSGSVKYKATIVRTWSDSNYNYTNTKHFAVYRAGSLGFEKIPVDSSKKMDDNYMEGIEPFNFNEAVPFTPMYMAGYFADKFDENVDESAERATKRVIASVEDAFRSTVDGYTTVIKDNSYVQMEGEDIHYALLPVWMLNTKYKGEMYQFAINGQTGKVAGKLPIDKFKLWMWRLGTGILGTGLVSAIAYFVMS